MRYVILASTAIIVVASALFGSSAPIAFAAFHCMRVHAVEAGFGGNANVQYVELRMDAPGQPFVGGHTIEFRDGAGTLKATFTFPANVANSAKGDSILIGSPEFNLFAHGGGADFTFSNANTVGANGGDPLHPVQSPDGKVAFAPTFGNCNFVTPVDSVAFGTVSGAASADYGTAAVALPGAAGSNALRLGNLNSNPTNNSAEYALQPVSATSFAVAMANLPADFSTPRNNQRTVLALAVAPPPLPSVGGVAELPVVLAAPLARSGDDHGRFGAMWYAAGGMLIVLGGLAGGLALARRRRQPR